MSRAVVEDTNNCGTNFGSLDLFSSLGRPIDADADGEEAGQVRGCLASWQCMSRYAALLILAQY